MVSDENGLAGCLYLRFKVRKGSLEQISDETSQKVLITCACHDLPRRVYRLCYLAGFHKVKHSRQEH